MRGRVALALLLTIGFYGLALGISAGLLLVAWLLWVNGHHVNRLTAFCVIGAGAILWSIIPRPEHFQPPGPALEAGSNPRLFKELNDVASRVGEPMPHEVYLVPDVNAGVLQRGGFMGSRGRRVMLLGLPLLQVLTVSEMRAVLAHEFGHYHGGDTKLAPWIYKTREAIIRTVRQLSGSSSVLHLPFVWYGQMFLRVTQAISRRQEFIADALAARTVGGGALTSGLRTVFGAALAYDGYWREEVVPVLSAGFLPPLADGFAQFLREPRVADAVNRATQEEMTTPRVHPYDSHPSLPDRIKALEGLPPGPASVNEPPALSLLENAPGIEPPLAASLLKPGAPALRPVSWRDVGIEVQIPYWEARVRREASLLAGQTVADIPRLMPSGKWADDARRSRFVTIGAALAVALVGGGWTLESLPGAPPVLHRGADSVEPFGVVEELESGKLTDEAWQERAAALGIANLRLSVT
jgi:Zn-dependent protease with chaperone function